MGEHKFVLQNCNVASAVDGSGNVSSDPIVGCSVTNSPKYAARLVDLDVYQQGVSTIYGMQVTFNLADGTTVTGTMDRATLNSLWWNAIIPTRSWSPSDYAQGSYGGDMNACGVFQTVIRFDMSKYAKTSSPLLNALMAASLVVDGNCLLSFKFTVDAYENVAQNANFRQGRFTGTIGIVKPNEPLYNPGQRWLLSRVANTTDPWFWPAFNNAPYMVDAQRNVLVVDLANSICRQDAGGICTPLGNGTVQTAPPGGDMVDIGTLTANLVAADGTITALGPLNYSSFFYNNNADIAEVPLTAAQVAAFDTGSLQLSMSRTDLGNQVILAEAPGVPVYTVEVRAICMAGAPGTTAQTTVYVSLNGKPVANKQMGLFIESVHGNTPGATVPPSNPGDTPQADGALAATITTTDANGFATVNLKVMKDPGSRTSQLDGQLYFIIVFDPAQTMPPVPPADWPNPIQEHMISVIVWSDYQVNTNPTWTEIQTMMAPYMKLYASMRKQLDLTDQNTFYIYAMNPPWFTLVPPGQPAPPPGPLGISKGATAWYMSRSIDDPSYMPITRDLSPNKVMTVMHYIKNLQDAPPPTTSTNA